MHYRDFSISFKLLKFSVEKLYASKQRCKGTRQKCLAKAILMSTHSLCLEEKKKRKQYFVLMFTSVLLYESLHEKTNNLGFRPGLTQTGLYSYRGRPEL